MAQGHLLGNRYRLEAVVGRGGMGTVWLAHDEVLDREVAVKEVLLPPGLGPAERDVLYQRTFREARASARLNHPGVVTVHDVVEETGRPWIVMEYVRARSLQDMIDQDGPLAPRKAAEIGRQTLAALRHAHQKGILHRDVKPSNVLITEDDRAVLTDFGIAQVEGDAALTQTGLVMGSPAYIPPERAKGERAVPASDLWALGATLYAAVEGRSPYERSDALASLAAALSEPVPPPRRAGSLRQVLEGLLAREPVARMTADQALPMLAAVATAPESRQAQQIPDDDATVLDAPPRSVEDYSAETMLDSTQFEVATRVDSGDMRSEGYGPTQGGGWQRSTDPRGSYQDRGQYQPPPPIEPYHQGTEHYTPPARGGRRRTRTRIIVIVAAILVAAAVVAGALIVRDRWATADASDDKKNTRQTSGPGGSTGSQYERVAKAGFSVEVPKGWRFEAGKAANQQFLWRSPDSKLLIQVDIIPYAESPQEKAEAQERRALKGGGNFSNYKRVAITPLTYRNTTAADWEFTWVDKSTGVASRTRDRFFRIGGTSYALYVKSPANDWDGSLVTFDHFYESFQVR